MEPEFPTTTHRRRPQPSPKPPPADLISTLDRASQSLKLLPPSQSLASLRHAYHALGSFLSDLDADEAMSDRTEESEAESMAEVEEGMRECAIQSKRRKRGVRSEWVKGREEEVVEVGDFGRRRREAVELALQFRG